MHARVWLPESSFGRQRTDACACTRESPARSGRPPLDALYRSTRLYRNYRAAQLKRWTESDAQMARFYAQFISEGDLCFDIGANLGCRTKVFLGLGATVVAVEPQEACMRALRRAYTGHPRTSLVQAGVSAQEGEDEMLISSQWHEVSSFSREWINAVRQSGRQQHVRWKRKQRVPMTTLDALIARHGRPAFIKIDVEGFEGNVLRGLSSPVDALSFEYSPETPDAAFACIDRIEAIGQATFNVAVAEHMQLDVRDWMGADDMKRHLAGLIHALGKPGDVYARYPRPEAAS
jgi:FkbM family methyltransferase